MWPRRTKAHLEDPAVALSEAQKNLTRIKKRTSEVKQVAAAQRNLLERNQFVERLEIIMGGNR